MLISSFSMAAKSYPPPHGGPEGCCRCRSRSSLFVPYLDELILVEPAPELVTRAPEASRGAN